ncbi:hypothetical protein D0864_15635 [Hortaea werneckii]|uniref:Uncharacterized protein n=1 Tax=Hortaea werneckii TaxID=91943 RepID=A0A3M7BX30_HORWE|nr:hypothetical protein D0864_15635 [Hortaea werneckii]
MAADREPPMGAQAILDALHKCGERLDRIEQHVANITARMSASNYNSSARTQNSLLSGPNDAITPLRSPSTNAAIPAFPATPNAINQLPAAAVNALLTTLEQATNGSIAARRERIGIAIGLAVKRNVSEAP